MSITVIDIAKAAGVSRTTVSNVFKGNGKYTDETRNAVLEAAKQLGYKPNLAARSLITNRSYLIGLILPSYVGRDTLTNSPFYNIIMDSIYSILRLQAHYDLIIFSVPSRGELAKVSDWIDTRNVDGILTLGEFDVAFMQDLHARDVPVVLIDNYTFSQGKFSRFSYINSDDQMGGYLATRHLLEKGYKQIALCGLELRGPLMHKRYLGYKQALKEAGRKEHVFDKVGPPFEAGLQFADVLASQQFDAAFCSEDMVAVGLVHGMLKRGVQVGQACRVVGFDNITIKRQIFPELTAVDISTRRAKPRRTPAEDHQWADLSRQPPDLASWSD
jgi:LacI family transcriptional regulator